MRNFQEIFTIQEDLLERAERFSVPVVDVQDLDGAARKVVKHVVGQLGRTTRGGGVRQRLGSRDRSFVAP